jgi:hypothetical protein
MLRCSVIETNAHIDIAALRQAVRDDCYLIGRHAQERMGLRKITHNDLKFVVATGDAIEEHPDNQPDPKVLFMAYVQGEPLYVSCAFDGNCVYIVTVHRYDAAKWHDPWTRRRE